MSRKKFKPLCFDIEGRVAALSHTFRLVENPLYIVELESNSESHYIIIRREKQLAWHKEIIPGSSYKFTHMKKDIIYKEKYDIEIFTTTRDSSYTKTKEADLKFLSIENVEECKEFVSYKGIVTSFVNKEAGIFKLDGKVLLVASFLMEVSAELVGEKKPNEKHSSCLDISLFCVGDELKIYNAHLLKGREGLLTLVCCGRSLIRNCREFFPIYDFWKSKYGILHCLHVFNFGLSFLNWLCDLEAFFLHVVFKHETSKEKIKRYQWKDKEGLLCKYVEEQLKNVKKESRSLLLEFLLCDHFCVLKQEFEVFHLFSVDQLLNYEELGSSQESVKDLNSHWCFSYFGKDVHKWVLFGVLCVSRAGTLRVELNGYYINLVVVGSKGDLYTKLNHTVAVYNFDYIHEEFDMDDESLNQKYIVIHSTHVISINDSNSDETRAKNCKNVDMFQSKTNYELTLKSISGLNFFFAGLHKNEISKFFMANASIEHKDQYGNKESWNTVLRFKGRITDYYPFLSEQALLKGRLNMKKSVDFSFRKTVAFSWMKNFQKQFGTTECTPVPLEFEVQKIINVSRNATDKIKDILKDGDGNTGYFNVEGKLIQKWFMTPKFDSQIVDIPSSLKREGIGVPGSKVIRLLLEDDEGYNIWVYLTTGNQLHICPYTLGFIPGAVVNITWLQKSLSQKGSVYLSSTLFSNFSILKFDNVKKKKEINGRRHHFLHELTNMSSGSVGLAFATVSCVLNVTMKNVCSSCEYDIENGSCSFPGCHANDCFKMAGFAKIIIDDGTNTASLFIKDIEMIKILFFINNIQFSLLNEIVDSEPLTYKFKSFREKDFISQNEKIFAKFVTNPEVFRPLKIIYRIFPNKGAESNMLELFALDITNLNPTKDVSLLRKPQYT